MMYQGLGAAGRTVSGVVGWRDGWITTLGQTCKLYAEHVHTDYDDKYVARVRRAQEVFRAAVPVVWIDSTWLAASEIAKKMPFPIPTGDQPIMQFQEMLFAFTFPMQAVRGKEEWGKEEMLWVLFSKTGTDIWMCCCARDEQGEVHFTEAYLNNSDAESRFFYGLFYFLASPAVVRARLERGNRAERRRLEKLKIEPSKEPQFVLLRRDLERSKYQPTGEVRDIEWAFRWTVSGHWRQQWVPSSQRHKLLWIMPYIKGPEDKPLKLTGYKVVR